MDTVLFFLLTFSAQMMEFVFFAWPNSLFGPIHTGRVVDKPNLKGCSHRKRTGIRPEVRRRIATHFNCNFLFAQFGTNSNSCQVWTPLHRQHLSANPLMLLPMLCEHLIHNNVNHCLRGAFFVRCSACCVNGTFVGVFFLFFFEGRSEKIFWSIFWSQDTFSMQMWHIYRE